MHRALVAMDKITVPVLPPVVVRRRLLRLLDRQSPLTWISGMAGCGKTTLAASYLAERGKPCLWYHLEASDQDPAGFFHSLTRALRRAVPEVPHPLPRYSAAYALGVPAFARGYFMALAARLPQATLLVFDDYHTIPAESPFHAVFLAGITALGHPVIVLSRHDPPPAYGGLLARRTLRLIGPAELRFSPAESRRLLQLELGRRVAAAEAEGIHALTRGWAAGLIIMAQDLKRGHAPASGPQAGALDELSAFFTSELFSGLDAPMRDFLLGCAWLPHLRPAPAAALTGREDAAHLLAMLEREHLFLERATHPAPDGHAPDGHTPGNHASGGPEPVYRLHPLLREFLQKQAASSLPPLRLQELKARAARLLIEAGAFAPAFELMDHDAPGRMALIQDQAAVLMEQGRSATLEGWIAGLPDSCLEENPWMPYWLGVSRQHSAPDRARRDFERAFAGFEGQGDRPGTLMAWSGVVESILYEWHDFTRLDPWIAWAFEQGRVSRAAGMLPDGPGRPAAGADPNLAARVCVSMMCALIFRRPEHPDLMAWVERALTLARRTGDLRLRIEAWDWAIIHACWQGNFARAGILKQETREGLVAYEKDPAVSLHLAWLDIAMHIFTRVPDAGVLGRIEHCLALGEERGVRLWEKMFLINGVYAALMQEKPARAGAYLARLGEGLSPQRYHEYALYHNAATLHHLMAGDTLKALEHAREALSVAEETGYVFVTLICRFARAQVLAARGEHPPADRDLQQVGRQAEGLKAPVLVFMATLARARLAFITGDAGQGAELLRAALQRGRANDLHTFIWWWQPELLADLLPRALALGIESDYVGALIREHRIRPREAPCAVPDWPWELEIRTLGGFEVRCAGAPLSLGARAHRKPLELLKVLVAHGGQAVSAARLMDILWPDAEGDLAHSAFSTTLGRLRGLLDCRECLVLADGRLSLDPQRCGVDVWAFEALCDQVQEGRSPDPPNADPARAALALYQGPFLADEDAPPWVLAPRERLRERFVQLVLHRAHQCREKPAEAVACLRAALEIDPLEEAFYQRLLRCHHALGQASAVERVFRHCTALLQAGLGVKPSPATLAAYRNRPAAPDER